MSTIISPNYSKQRLKNGLIKIITAHADLPVTEFNHKELQGELTMFMRDLVHRDLLLSNDVPKIEVTPKGDKWGISSKDPVIATLLEEVFDGK